MVLNEVANSTLLPENSCLSFVNMCVIDNTLILQILTFKKKKNGEVVCANKRNIKPAPFLFVSLARKFTHHARTFIAVVTLFIV